MPLLENLCHFPCLVCQIVNTELSLYRMPRPTALPITLNETKPKVRPSPLYHTTIIKQRLFPALVACGKEEVVEGGWVQVVFDVLDFVLE